MYWVELRFAVWVSARGLSGRQPGLNRIDYKNSALDWVCEWAGTAQHTAQVNNIIIIIIYYLLHWKSIHVHVSMAKYTFGVVWTLDNKNVGALLVPPSDLSPGGGVHDLVIMTRTYQGCMPNSCALLLPWFNGHWLNWTKHITNAIPVYPACAWGGCTAVNLTFATKLKHSQARDNSCGLDAHWELSRFAILSLVILVSLLLRAVMSPHRRALVNQHFWNLFWFVCAHDHETNKSMSSVLRRWFVKIKIVQLMKFRVRPVRRQTIWWRDENSRDLSFLDMRWVQWTAWIMVSHISFSFSLCCVCAD